VILFLIRVSSHLSVVGDLKHFVWFRFDDWLIITIIFIGLFLLFTGILADERRNSWSEINEKAGD
jgi:hypothetical protein